MPPGWSRIRRRILMRDHYRCTRCGAPAKSVDHIVPASRGGHPTADNNLASLCGECHAVKSQREASEGRRLARP